MNLAGNRSDTDSAVSIIFISRMKMYVHPLIHDTRLIGTFFELGFNEKIKIFFSCIIALS